MRLLLYHVTGNWWVVTTPDGDVYEEELYAGNPDFTNFVYVGAGLGVALPVAIRAADIYMFGPMIAIEYQQFLTQGRVLGIGLQAVLGVVAPPPLAIAGAVAIPAAPVAPPLPPPPPPPVALPWLALDTESG